MQHVARHDGIVKDGVVPAPIRIGTRKLGWRAGDIISFVASFVDQESGTSQGQSGNPSGKPKGARSRLTILGEKIMQDDADEIIQAVVSAAKAGDPTAMRLCVERLIPARKGRPVAFDLPKITKPADIVAALGAITAKVASGELTPDEAASVAAIIELKRRAIETVEMDHRIRVLEERGTR